MDNLLGRHAHSAVSHTQFYVPFLANSSLAGARGSPVWMLQSCVAVVAGIGTTSRQLKGKMG